MHIAKGISEWEIRWEEAIEKGQVAVEWSSEWMIIAYYGEAHKSWKSAQQKHLLMYLLVPRLSPKSAFRKKGSPRLYFLCISTCAFENPFLPFYAIIRCFLDRLLDVVQLKDISRRLDRQFLALPMRHEHFLPKTFLCLSRHHWVASISRRILERSEKKYFAPLLVVFTT